MSYKKRCSCTLYIILILIISSLSAKEYQVAVLDFVGNDVSAKDAAATTDFFRGDLVETGDFIVLDRDNMTSILEEQAFQASGCTETACAVEIGKLLSVRYMLPGTVTKFGDKYVVAVELVDVESGQIVGSAKEVVSSFLKIIDATKIIAKKFSEDISKVKQEKGSNFKKKLGVALSGAGCMAMGGLFSGIGAGQGKKADDFYNNTYMEETNPTVVKDSYTEYSGLVRRSNAEYIVGFSLLGSGAILVIAGLIMPKNSKKKTAFIPNIRPRISAATGSYQVDGIDIGIQLMH